MNYKTPPTFSIDQMLRAFYWSLMHRPDQKMPTWRRDSVPVVELQAIKICSAELIKWLNEQK